MNEGTQESPRTIATIIIVCLVISALFIWGMVSLMSCTFNDTEANSSSNSSPQAKPTKAPLFVFNGETSQGTPIVDGGHSGFRYSWPDMIETEDSDCFSEAGYCKDREVLVLTFRDSGKTYLYLDVSENVWEDFLEASSQGSFFNSEIKDCYVCYRWN